MTSGPDESLPPTEAEPRFSRTEAPALPDRIGPYRLLELLGEGGMGQVFLAEQQQPLQRRVALKILQSRRLGDLGQSRFELEGQALARMSHPNIAQVFDTGQADGHHFLAMELVNGVTIDTWADQQKLTIEERCQLLLQVCAGVEHCHRRGILHRDLKPLNILVAETATGPVVKVIDFGVAKVVEDDTGLTQGVLLGTPAYMSPEQLESSIDVDTRTDVYSLGLTLYHLLVGKSPFVGKKLTDLAQRTTTEVPLPSTYADDEGVAARRSTVPEALRISLRGDLDAIVGKATACDRDARYGSADALASDLRAFLENLPVAARRGTTWYRFGKAIRRQRGKAIAVGLVLLSLSAGAIGTVAGLVRSRQAEARLIEEAETVGAINTFLQDMLAAADPGELGREVLVRDVLDRAEERMSVLTEKPRIEVEVRTTLGRTYRSLGDLEAAREHLDSAVAKISELGLLSTDTGRVARLELAQVAAGQGQHDEAMAAIEAMLTEITSSESAKRPTQLEAEVVLAGSLLELGKFQEALDLMQAATARSSSDEPHFWTARSHLTRALLLTADYPAAETMAKETVAMMTAELGPEHPRTLAARNTLSGALWFQGKMDELSTEMEESLVVYRRVLGEDHPHTLDVANNLAMVRNALGDREGAEALTRDNLERRRRLLGPEHHRTLDSMSGLAQYVQDGSDEGDQEALRLFLEMREIGVRVLGPTHPSYQNISMLFGRHLQHLGRTAESESIFAEVAEARREVLGADHPDTLASEQALAEVRSLLGGSQSAETKARSNQESKP